MTLSPIDLAVLAAYALMLLGVALWVSREPKGQTKDTEDYFLAGKTLPWWAIGASLIAANISAEQITGQSGDGFVMGIAIAAYEWQAAIVLLIVAKYFLPIFLKRGIYTMPQFLETRYGGEVKALMSVYWIALFVSVNLTALLWLGGLTIQQVAGIDIMWAMIGLGGFALLYSLYGGLKAVALTDIIQVVILIVGGLAITFIALDLVSGGTGPLAGLSRLTDEVPERFRMILSEDNPSYEKLPGIWTLLGGLWVLHFSYWGFNQYIIQRALGAESLPEAQKGLAFAAFLKLFIPLIVVIPGIAALILTRDGVLSAAVLDPSSCTMVEGEEVCGKSDRTYGALMTLAPVGLRGLIFAALVAAIVSSLASMMNSISTIFTMDIYRDYIAKNRTERHYVMVGRITAFVAMVIALIAARPFLGGMDSAFQTIQEYTGYIAPGVVAVFLLGFFFQRTNAYGAFAILLTTMLANVALKFGVADLPFIIRIWIVFLTCLVVGIGVSYATDQPTPDRPVDLGDISFATRTSFNIAAILVAAILVGIYVVLW